MPLFQSRLFFRIISKNKEVYLLKIISLAIAFACSTLVILFSLNEFGYDRFHQNSNSLFRILQRNTSETFSGNRLSCKIPFEVFNALRKRDSMVVSRVKVMNEVSVLSLHQTFHDQRMYMADPVITSIFSFEIIDGSIEKFKEKGTTILSSSTAKRFFGTDRISGKKIKVYTLDDTLQLSVVAVYADFPQNSHGEFNFFAQLDSLAIQSLGFGLEDSEVYGRLLQGDIDHNVPLVYSEAKQSEMTYKLQALPEIYFGPRVVGEEAVHGDHYSIVILICIASLIFFLALTSFINLTTLTLPYRSKELAIKKLAGTSQFNLILTFAKESFSIVGISILIGIALLVLTSRFLEPILSIDLVLLLVQGDAIFFLVLAALALLSGMAPLFMTFRFAQATPTRLLSTETITFPLFKRVIAFLQLGISIFLIVASIVIKRQVNYSLLKEPGRNHDQIVYLRYPNGLTNEGLRSQREAWKKYHPNIVDVMATSQLPNHIGSKELNSDFYFISVDPAFRDFFNLKMSEGNWFKANDGDSIIVVNRKGSQHSHGTNQKNIIGVVDNLNDQFNQPERPIKINIAPYYKYNFLCVRVLEVDIRRTVQYLSNQFKEGNQLASISYLNKGFEDWIHYQDRLNTLSEILAIISGLLSCCAVYGLSVSLVRDKLKQIAIHKMCGASTIHITRILVLEFSKQMLIAVLIFGPLTFLFLRELLRNFVYATHFNWMDPVFPLAYCASVIIILCGFQALSLNRTDLTSSLKG
jgi:putative ABC transport system permease protein